MSAFFVTATGTDIGKTFVTAGLMRHLRSAGKPVRAFKPIVSGFDITNVANTDTGVLLEAMGLEVTPQSLEVMSPWRFAAPLSPDMAAAREGKALDFEKIVAACRARIGQGTLFIEGVGGVMVPLDARHTVLDLMAALRLPLIAVTGSYLGTISHTLTAMEVIARAGLHVAVLIVNESAGSAVPLADTVAALERFLPGIAIRALPRQPAGSDFASLAALF
jgi:dethiobiotin synthetase